MFNLCRFSKLHPRKIGALLAVASLLASTVDAYCVKQTVYPPAGAVCKACEWPSGDGCPSSATQFYTQKKCHGQNCMAHNCDWLNGASFEPAPGHVISKRFGCVPDYDQAAMIQKATQLGICAAACAVSRVACFVCLSHQIATFDGCDYISSCVVDPSDLIHTEYEEWCTPAGSKCCTCPG